MRGYVLMGAEMAGRHPFLANELWGAEATQGNFGPGQIWTAGKIYSQTILDIFGMDGSSLARRLPPS